MKKSLLACLIALCIAPAAAHAAVVSVRIEGASRTLFEGQLEVTNHNVQSLSDRAIGAIRPCDGTNNGANGSPVPTGTSATFDALALQGQGFDGDWYDQYDDYLISKLGTETASWRLFGDNTFATVGGCQLRMGPGGKSSVLWTAHSGALLSLSVAGNTVTTAPGAEVYVAAADGTPGQALGTADGNGQLGLNLPGGAWYRIKARKSGSVRSARVDYCPSSCPAKPADMSLRVAPAPVFYGPGGSVLADSPALAKSKAAVRLSRPRAGTSGRRRGRVVVSWKVLDAGVGLLRWSIASDDLTTRSHRWVTRARGRTATSASLRLPAGRVYALRFTSVDRLQRDDATSIGRVLVPIDDRSRTLARRGSWRRVRSSTAWDGTLLRGRRGARLSVKLAAGRPALDVAGHGRAVVRIGSRVVKVRGGHTAYGKKRRKAGRVTVTVVRGSIDLDGVAAAP
jgi:hypothetical protein